MKRAFLISLCVTVLAACNEKESSSAESRLEAEIAKNEAATVAINDTLEGNAQKQAKIAALKLKVEQSRVKLEEAKRRELCTLGKKGTICQDRLKDGSLGPKMVWLPVGSFRMGDIQGEGRDNEKPVHTVTVDRFAMGQYEVTFAEYDKFAKATKIKKPDDEKWGRGNRPVINISWQDATAYATWLSAQTGHTYRLPTEAQWEYAARAGTTTSRYWGNDPDKACEYANVYDKTSEKKKKFGWTHHKCTDDYVHTAPVGSFKPNKFGLYDMIGNVWEWTCSEYSKTYSDFKNECKNHAKDRLFVLRGASWNNIPRYARSANRYRCNAGNVGTGMRLARIP